MLFLVTPSFTSGVSRGILERRESKLAETHRSDSLRSRLVYEPVELNFGTSDRRGEATAFYVFFNGRVAYPVPRRDFLALRPRAEMQRRRRPTLIAPIGEMAPGFAIPIQPAWSTFANAAAERVREEGFLAAWLVNRAERIPGAAH